jgi:tRNA threonylcarbamoyladenosine biosynthesis protein TsaE
MRIEVNNLNELSKISDYILREFPKERIIVLDAEMGKGKTTFIKHFCEDILEAEDEVSSPTFAIVNVYKYKNNKAYHFDFYRLNSVAEALDIGFDEYLYSGDYCFIEWPEIIMSFMPEEYLLIKISEGKDDNSRVFDISKQER